MKLQLEDFQWYQRASGSSKGLEPVSSMSAVSESAACLPSPVADSPSALPLPPPVSNSSGLFTRCKSLYVSCCTVLLYFSRNCVVRLKMFIFCVFMYYLCEKYYKPILVQCYIADCFRWAPWLTLLDFTNKLDFWIYMFLERNLFVCRGLNGI